MNRYRFVADTFVPLQPAQRLYRTFYWDVDNLAGQAVYRSFVGAAPIVSKCCETVTGQKHRSIVMNAKPTTLAAVQDKDPAADVLIARNVDPPRKATLSPSIPE